MSAPLTWKQFREALDAWGLRDEDVILGIRLRGDAGTDAIQIARGVDGVVIGTMGRITSPVMPPELSGDVPGDG